MERSDSKKFSPRFFKNLGFMAGSSIGEDTRFSFLEEQFDSATGYNFVFIKKTLYICIDII